MNARPPWGLFVIAVVLLVVLGPTVPDEPAHLSGVMVVLGLIAALAGVLSGIATAVRGTGSVRESAVWATIANAFVLVAAGGWFVADALADLSAPAL